MWLLVLIALGIAAFIIAKLVLAKSAPHGADGNTHGEQGSNEGAQTHNGSTQSVAHDGSAVTSTSGAAATPATAPAAHGGGSVSGSGAGAGAGGGAGLAAAAGAGLAAAAGTGAAAAAGLAANASASSASGTEAARARAARYGVDTGDSARDIREMIKILNLRESDASRLGISKDIFTQLARGDTAQVDSSQLGDLHHRLGHLLS